VITLEDFQAAITSLLQLLPMQRQLTPSALVMAWDTFPQQARAELDCEMLRFAIAQRLMDPEPPKDQAPHIAMLRYLYPLEHNHATFGRGLRPDLAERMAAPQVFHDPAPVRHEHAPPPERPRLPGGSSNGWHPSQMTADQRRRHLERIATDVERIIAAGGDGLARNDEQLAQGVAWFRRALQGFWGMHCDGGGIAAAWIAANPREARAMVRDAIGTGATVAEPAGDIAGEVLAW
jgi:hypothetical protein